MSRSGRDVPDDASTAAPTRVERHVVLTHDNADFDALAASIGARIAWPGAEVWLPGRLSRPVRDFLALHRDALDVHRFGPALDPECVTHATVVDVRRPERLRSYGPLTDRLVAGEVTLRLVDHHPAAPGDLVGDEEIVEPVGAAATLVIEQIIASNASVTAIEATALALGIHADTGSLLWPGTTPRDARALAWCVDRGASPAVLHRYLSPGLDADQRAALCAAIQNMRIDTIGPVEVGITIVPLAKAITDLGLIVSELRRFFDTLGAVFGVFVSRKRTFVVGRSRERCLDVGAVLRNFGGGGHAGAGSALVRGQEMPAAVAERLREEMAAHPPTPRTVADIMTSPVVSLARSTPLVKVAECFGESGISGAPVLDGSTLVGVISQRDLARAERDGRMHLPVASCMAHKIHTTSLDATLDAALATVTAANVGRLPVVRDGLVVGIVSRTDLIRALYGADDA